jgi:putative transposase
MENKEEKIENIILHKTFSIHEKDLKIVRHAKKAIFDYKHLENMVNILLNNELKKVNSFENKEDRDYTIFNLLLNPIVMKAVISNNLGGEKTKENIELINNYFVDNKIFIALKNMGNILNDKNISMIIRRLNTSWTNIFKRREEYFANPSDFTGKPNFPKAKSLSKTYQYSIPLEDSKFSLKRKNILGLTLFKKQIHTRFKTNKYVTSKNIQSLVASYSHGHIYYNFTYIETIQPLFTIPKKIIKKECGLDIGVINTASLFINDKNTQSLIYSGSQFIKYNCFFNKQLAKINEEIAKNVIEYKIIIKENKEAIKIPILYNSHGKALIKEKSQLFEHRNRYFDGEMNKISSGVLTYLKDNEVTDLVISKNLSFTKESGEIKMQKKDKQKFYQIPFGKLLNLIEAKAPQFNINIEDIDEAYTSKTSCLTRDVNKNQKKRHNGLQVVPTDLNGSRGTKGSKLGRGQFKDKELNITFNSDLNGAANHIKVGFPKVKLSRFRNNLWKVCSPKKVKSTNELDRFLIQ